MAKAFMRGLSRTFSFGGLARRAHLPTPEGEIGLALRSIAQSIPSEDELRESALRDQLFSTKSMFRRLSEPTRRLIVEVEPMLLMKSPDARRVIRERVTDKQAEQLISVLLSIPSSDSESARVAHRLARLLMNFQQPSVDEGEYLEILDITSQDRVTGGGDDA